MKTICTIKEMQSISSKLFTDKITVGFVPTMGALHKGHLSLIRYSLDKNDISIVSIFVNPTQFSPSEDFSKYPKTIDTDIEKLKELNVDYLFLPQADDIYPDGEFFSAVKLKLITDKLCGLYRKGHFEGVCTICLKLLNIIMPTVAYFGQKDYQQYIVIKQMVKDFNMQTIIKSLPIVRDKDGLALSSRNAYLSYSDRETATNIYKSIQSAVHAIRNKHRNVLMIKEIIENRLKEASDIKIQYVAISTTDTLEELEGDISVSSLLIAIAAFVGSTRLIDNAIVEISE